MEKIVNLISFSIVLTVIGIGIYLFGTLFIAPVFGFAPDLIYLVVSVFVTFLFLLITAAALNSKDSASTNIFGCLGVIVVPIGGIVSLYFIFKIIA